MRFVYLLCVSAITLVTAAEFEDVDTYSKERDISVLVMGLSGAGVSLTVGEIINSPINKTKEPTVFEYSWHVKVRDGDKRFRIAAAPGMITGKSDEEDATILSTIKEYLEKPSGLNGTYPSIIILVSRFDERAAGETSPFVKMLKRVEMIESMLRERNSPSNIIFHFTHVMSGTKTEQRRPQKNIDNFRSIIRNYTKFPEPIFVTLGENEPEQYDLRRSNGYISLPNRDLYPKNIIEYMQHICMTTGDSSGYETLLEAFPDGNINPSPTITAFSLKEQSTNRIPRNPNNVEDTEISRALQEAFENLDESLKHSYPRILQLVQLAFQNQLNITKKSELPKTTAKIAEMFQALPFHTASLSIVQEAFQLNQPIFDHPLIVGHGYDITKDEALSSSPYILDNNQPTELGYSLPDIFAYSDIEENEQEVVNFKIFDSADEYPEIRMNDLELGDIMNKTLFSGQVRPSYNIRPGVSDDFVGLKAIKEFRGFNLELMQSAEVTEQFKNDLNALKPFNQSDRDSPKEWTKFFRKYGTHIVSTAHGGGYMEATAKGDALRDYFWDSAIVNGVKNTLVDFQGLPQQLVGKDVQISHNFVGGSPHAKLATANYLTEGERDELLKNWKATLKYDPRILQMNLRLLPIDEVAMSVNSALGYNVQDALTLFLEGNLKYVRPKSRPSIRDSTTPSTTTVTYPSAYWRSTTARVDERYERSQWRQTTAEAQNNCTCPVTNSSSSATMPTTEVPRDCSTTIAPIALPTPTSLLKYEDYTENTVGQGYNLLKDIVLPKSPFKFPLRKKFGMLVPNIVTVTPVDTVCSFRTFKMYDSLKEYVESKYKKMLSSISPYYYPQENRYEWMIRPGHTILDNSTNPRFSLLEEKRYYELKLVTNWGLNGFTPDFVQTVNKLPEYTTSASNINNCTVLRQWNNFFEKFGTHLVTGGYAGTISEGYVRGFTTADGKQHYSDHASMACEPIPSSNAGKYPKPSAPFVSFESAKFLEMSYVINYIREGLLHQVDSVILTLLNKRENKLCAF